MIQLLGVVGSLAQDILEGKVEKEKAKSEDVENCGTAMASGNLSWLSLQRIVGKMRL